MGFPNPAVPGGQPFPNEVVGGNGALLIAQVQSPNFSLSGQTGWAILQNGDAYFYQITSTGSVIISGSGQGWYVYNGTPGFGNPPVAYAVPDTATEDPFGNALPRTGGVVSQAPGSAFIQMLNATLLIGSIAPYASALPAGLTAGTTATGQTVAIGSGEGPEADAVPSQMTLGDSGAGGTLTVASSDGSTYDTQRLTLDGTALPQTINSTGATTITGCSASVAARKYKFHARVIFQGGSAAGTANFSVSGPSFSSAWISGLFIMSNGTSGMGAQTLDLGPVDSPALTLANSVADIVGEAVFTAAGTFAFQCAEGSAGDTVIIEQVTVDLMPVTAA